MSPRKATDWILTTYSSSTSIATAFVIQLELAIFHSDC